MEGYRGFPPGKVESVAVSALGPGGGGAAPTSPPEEVVVAGFGGQGVLTGGILLAQAGMMQGLHVSWVPAYGAEQRGGTAYSAVVLSRRPVVSPLVFAPTTVLAMNRPSFDRFVPKVREGGIVLYNASIVELSPDLRSKLEAKLGRLLGIPATSLAEEIGDARVAVNVLVGAYAALTGVVDLACLKLALREVLPPHRHRLIPANERALEAGFEAARSAV
ncbi:MAG: 2-oxoglutarate oxidoreductase, gamma subunit [Brockia lithotrophica]|uniref:2-oxoglutarate oxidoreductase, gamma subunit n=1 Tax=Brockia lithotrophica TaxID=933949 RepID=A0A2T5G6C2_9BACL|nr:2-oxoacid:acceptor oxidoreductase family protein [Brockia lithotrophica]PTQ51730.1 MAG: 2-oxoglutarate oxidoreductase, gamma subunit [Brockia lithotrophica]